MSVVTDKGVVRRRALIPENEDYNKEYNKAIMADQDSEDEEEVEEDSEVENENDVDLSSEEEINVDDSDEDEGSDDSDVDNIAPRKKLPSITEEEEIEPPVKRRKTGVS